MTGVVSGPFRNIVFDLKIYDLEAGFKKRGVDPGNKERVAFIKRTGLNKDELDEIIAAINSKY